MKYRGLLVVSLLIIGLIVLPVTRTIKIVMIVVALVLLLFLKAGDPLRYFSLEGP